MEQQYEILKLAYEEKFDNYRDLTQKSKLYFSIVSIFLTALFFKFPELKSVLQTNSDLLLPFRLLIASIALSSISITTSLTILSYRTAFNPSRINNESVEFQNDLNTFYLRRMADFESAIQINIKRNKARAWLISFCSITLNISFVLSLIFIYLFIS